MMWSQKCNIRNTASCCSLTPKLYRTSKNIARRQVSNFLLSSNKCQFEGPVTRLSSGLGGAEKSFCVEKDQQKIVFVVEVDFRFAKYTLTVSLKVNLCVCGRLRSLVWLPPCFKATELIFKYILFVYALLEPINLRIFLADTVLKTENKHLLQSLWKVPLSWS